MPTSPIQNRIGMVFIPVLDIQKSIAWYNQLLGLPAGELTHDGKIYELVMQGETGLILDSHKVVHNSSQPLCFFWTDDIRATYTFLQTMAVEIVSEVADIGSVAMLIFKDPDHNLLMVCQANR
jgi:predicted enzyme related to lactoylglutathione lyase